MSTLIIQNRFDGGHAEDLRTIATDQCEKSLNFDVFTNPHKLIPYRDTKAETVDSGTIADMEAVELSDVDISLIAGTYYLTAVGFESGASSKPAFYTKAISGDSFAEQAVGATTAFIKGSGVVYKDKFFALSLSGSTYTLNRYNSAGSVTAIGTISSSSTFRCKLFVHPQDNVLYIAIGTTISAWDGSSLTTLTTLLKEGYEATSLTDYGTYLAIAMRPLRGNGNSFVGLWGRDLTLNTFQDYIDFGEGRLGIIENLDNNLIGVMQPQVGILAEYQITPTKIIVKKYSGGQVETIKTLQLSAYFSLDASNYGIVKVKNQQKLYFGSAQDDCMYIVGRNKQGNYIITKGQYYSNGSTATSLNNISIIGDIIWTAGIVGSDTVLTRTRQDDVFTATSKYRTTINPSMPVLDRYKDKQLEAIRISYTGKSGGTIVVKYSIDGSAFTDIISESTTAAELIIEANNENSESPFITGKEFQFEIQTTGGVEVKEIAYKYSPTNTTI
jgi:hypothetical protein